MKPVPMMVFPVEWHVIEGSRVVYYPWQVLSDPTGGDAVYRFGCVTILGYAGDGLFSYQEDLYNPREGEDPSGALPAIYQNRGWAQSVDATSSVLPQNPGDDADETDETTRAIGRAADQAKFFTHSSSGMLNPDALRWPPPPKRVATAETSRSPVE